MALGINVVAVIVASFAAASAGTAPFPHGKTAVYKYYGDVKAGIIEPGAYASQFALEGTLHVKHDTSDPALKNAYYVALSNVKTGMHNGKAAHYQPTNTIKPIEDAAKPIEKPFLIIYDDNGRFEGVKIPTNEEAWSKNMKMAIASMLQLDLPNMKVKSPIIKPHSFISKESTIHGPCWITYDVHSKDPTHATDPNEFVVTKFSSPKNCSGFDVHTFNHVDDEGCQAKSEEPVNVASRRLFAIEKQGDDIVIKKLVAHGGSNYFPWNARSEAHYILTNTTFALERVVPVSEINLPPASFENVPIIRDITYLKPDGNYAPGAATDVTQGRRRVNLNDVVLKAKKMLGEAAAYLEENHVKSTEPDWKHGQTMNRLLQTMGYMDVASLESVFVSLGNSRAPRAVTIENIFLGIVPQVGTEASALFILNVIQAKKVSTAKATEMLSKLPLSIKDPSTSLLGQMEDLTKFNGSIDVEVRKAGILCFSTLMYRTFKDVPKAEQETRTEKYRQHFSNLLNSGDDYEMMVTYVMALRNIQVGNIPRLLDPIIRGDSEITDKPMHIRLLAIWAIEKSIGGDYHYAHDLLWPVMADTSLPVKLRIAAYEILMLQAPSMTDVLHMYWFMVYEPSEHLYNYHHTTIKSIANSVDPCKLHLRELVRKIMRFTRIHEWVGYKLSSAYSVDYKDEKYNHAEKLDTGVVVNELSGIPEVVRIEHIVTDGRKPISNFAIRLHIQGFDELVSLLHHGQVSVPGGLTSSNVLNVLKKAAEKLPITKNIHIDLILLRRGRAVIANHYNETTVRQLWNDVQQYVKLHADGLTINSQHVAYDNLFEKQVTSDMGLPVVFENRVPIVGSLKINYERHSGSQSKIVDLEIDGKIWRHGDYSISVYNTMSDVWHAIRRVTATDINLPLRASLSYDSQKHNLKMTFPRLPATKLSVAGILTHAKDVVTVNEDDARKLNMSCPSCKPVEEVSKGDGAKKSFGVRYNSKDTGLQYSASIFGCENGATPVTRTAELYRAFMSERKNDWNSGLLHAIMGVRQHLKNVIISPEMGSCSSIVHIEPSIVYPTSRIELGMRVSSEDIDYTNPSYHLSAAETIKIRATVNVIAAATNISARSWDLNVISYVSQGHTENNLQVRLSRKTPDETDFTICIVGTNTFPAFPSDPLRLGTTKEESVGQLTIAAGPTNGSSCARNETRIRLVMKAELSDEQKKAYIQETTSGACRADEKNPLYANPKNIVPKTLNCINQAARFTSLRKYSIYMEQQKVPVEIASMIHKVGDVLRSRLLPNVEYTVTDSRPENIRIKAEFPMQKDVVELSVATPELSYDVIDATFEKPRFNGFGPVIRPVWNLPLQNTRFNVRSLLRYTQNKLKICSVYPKIVLTGDGGSVSHSLSDQWTLISGDHYNERFAVFARTAGSNLATRVYMKDHQVEIVPKDDNSVDVMVDGQLVDKLSDGLLVPNDTNKWILKVTKNDDHIVVQMKYVAMVVVHAINHVALPIDTKLQGKVSGLCGHLDGSYRFGIPDIYTMPNV